jgi:RNase P subunit RPR2
MNPKHPQRHVGDLRPTQFFFSFGAGSVMDLPNFSVLIKSVPENVLSNSQDISEDRLLEYCKKYFGDKRTNKIKGLKSIPMWTESQALNHSGLAQNLGIPVTLFPKWFVCSHCRNLLHFTDSASLEFRGNKFQKEKHKIVHKTCQSSKEPMAIPVRFAVVCENGHLDEFPWNDFVHQQKGPCLAPKLKLIDHGTAGNISDIMIRCDNCGSQEFISKSFGEEGRASMPNCTGRHPQVDKVENCYQDPEKKTPMKQKPILVGASNAWFSLSFSSLYLSLEDEIEEFVARNWQSFNEVESLDLLKSMYNILSRHIIGLNSYSADVI